MKDKKKVRRKIIIPISIMAAIIVMLFTVWVIISPGTIRTYKGEKSLSEKFVMDIDGAPNGFFINSVNTDNPVLLLVSSGPGTDDYVFTDRYKDMKLEEDFTVVYWDYRSMGIAYDKNYDSEQITPENLINDTYEVTQYLKKRLSKDKIYIMGFSGGKNILEAPDKGFYLIPDAAHSPLWENPEKTCEILRQIKEKNTDE